MKILLILFSLTLFAPVISAQEPVKKEVESVILDIFEGMRQGDSSRVAGHIVPDATMYTVYLDAEGNSIRREGSLQGWLNAIAAPREEALDERLWDIEIRVDGALATVWTQYALYVGTTLSHCGVDAFQLFHDGSSWKVFHVADTRRKECQIPDEVSR